MLQLLQLPNKCCAAPVVKIFNVIVVYSI